MRPSDEATTAEEDERQTNKTRVQEKDFNQSGGFRQMKDSINRKAQRERSTMAASSDDCNGVVVNRAIDSTRGIPSCVKILHVG